MVDFIVIEHKIYAKKVKSDFGSLPTDIIPLLGGH